MLILLGFSVDVMAGRRGRIAGGEALVGGLIYFVPALWRVRHRLGASVADFVEFVVESVVEFVWGDLRLGHAFEHGPSRASFN
jgi:hypothetical protein